MDPDLVRQVLIKDFSHFVDRQKSMTASDTKTDRIWTKTLFNLRGEQWRDVR